MKKLISMALAGFFMFGGTTVFANNPNVQLVTPSVTIKGWDMGEHPHFGWINHSELEVITRNIGLNDDFLRVQLADEVAYFMSHNDLATIIAEISHFRQNEEIETYWNSETDVLEISVSGMSFISEREAVDPIDMDSINHDEWVYLRFLTDGLSVGMSASDTFLSVQASQQAFGGVAMISVSFDSEGGAIVAESEPEPAPAPEEVEDFSFDSVFGCNAEDIRTILVDDENEEFIFERIKVNIQDLRDAGLFSDEIIEQALELQATHGTPRMLNISWQFENMKMTVEQPDMLSDTQLRQLLEISRNTLENRERGGN